MEYAEIKNGKIKRLVSTNEPPPDSANWREIDIHSFAGHVGQDERMIEWTTGQIRPENELVSAGLIQDNRGRYWNTETQQELEITDVGQELPASYTDQEPPGRGHVSWNKTTGRWQVDKKAEEADRSQDLRIRRRSEFQLFDKYQTVLADDLSAKQTKEFADWRSAWLDAPATGQEPTRPEWFREY